MTYGCFNMGLLAKVYEAQGQSTHDWASPWIVFRVQLLFSYAAYAMVRAVNFQYRFD